MKGNITRTFLGALALVTTVGCGAGTPEEEQQQTAVEQGLSSLPDFIVATVQGPASVQSGQSLTTTVKVCNYGSVAASTTVAVYLSQDTVITPYMGGPFPPVDQPAGNAPVTNLGPSQCVDVQVTGTAYPPPPRTPGNYYLGAVVDAGNYVPEVSETNNTRVGSVIAISL
ncbi:hypothetical protein HPC49_20510 [Pyxidicoccus fallax]|uniref:CARDB domain-containing protein n=1 Tax=Pyxidicoccus fallax TaxID=394095 RepID=A0A848LD55_9BACT|nr:CARDB domain-containing protein [Pyxidicoccus fallax]NMO16627.1 hypothetical protein [Pyxidicoccus fallax]NPC80596.1 hypothetical protein [Pyxidicoccus fallax]